MVLLKPRRSLIKVYHVTTGDAHLRLVASRQLLLIYDVVFGVRIVFLGLPQLEFSDATELRLIVLHQILPLHIAMVNGGHALVMRTQLWLLQVVDPC